MNKLGLLMLAGVLAALTMCAQAQTPPPPPVAPAPPAWEDEVLATVNGIAITRKQVWWEMEQGWGGRVLDDLIVGMLVAAEATRQGVSVGAEEVDAEISRLQAEYPSPREFHEDLQRRGQTLKGLRITVQRDLLIEKLLARRMGLDEAGLRSYFEAHREQFAHPRRVRLYDIVTRTLPEAYRARERLAAGEPFSAVATELSRDPTARQGGDRGWVTPDDLLCARVAEVVFQLRDGQISDPVQCEDHCHVFYAAEVQPAQLLSFEQARAQVIRAIRQQRGISKQFYVTLLMRAADVQVRWPAHAYLNEMYQDLRRIKVVVDGRRLELPRPARLLPSGNLVVPAAPLFAAMGTTMLYTPETGILAVHKGNIRLKLVKGSELFAANDRELRMSEAPFIEDSTLMISPRAPVEALGGTVLWNREENTLYVNSGGPSGAPAVEEINLN